MAGEQEESRRKIGAVTILALRWPDMQEHIRPAEGPVS